jgi:C-methyltransferase C-terminal domain
LLFEMPDCTKFVRACDYSFLWEEHITYFSTPTLRTFVNAAGLAPDDIIVHSYPLEDSLIAVVRIAVPRNSNMINKTQLEDLLMAGRGFADRFAERRAELQALLGAWKRSGKRVAVFGAGHLAAKFVNLYDLKDLVECVIDDNPDKQTLLMPGSRLPIRGSAVLDDIDLCLLSLNPESEQKVLAKNQAYLARGGTFLSIFALSRKSVYNASAA